MTAATSSPDCGHHLAIELRIERARTTKDVDLRVVGSPEDILDRPRGAARRDLGDFMVFTIRLDDRHPARTGAGPDSVYFAGACCIPRQYSPI